MSEPRTHLIWSIHWGRWHRRSEDGGACGYTDDVLQAGVFETSKAMAYHDVENAHPRDKAVPIAEVREQVAAKVEKMSKELEAAQKRLEMFDEMIAGIRKGYE